MADLETSQRTHALLMQHLQARGVEAIDLRWNEPLAQNIGRAVGAVALGALFGGFAGLFGGSPGDGAGLLLFGCLLLTTAVICTAVSRRGLILGPTRFRLTVHSGSHGDPAAALAMYGSPRLLRWVDEAIARGGAVPAAALPPRPDAMTPQERMLRDLEQRIAPGPEAGAVSLVEQDGELAVVPERVAR
jgi:hypothetical protein